MSDLTYRLLEAIQAKEEKARAIIEGAGDGPWRVASRWGCAERGGTSVIGLTESDIHFIADNDPSSVLRRCEADRKLVELHGMVWRNIGWLEWDEGEHAEMSAEIPVCGLCVPKHSSFPRREDVLEGPCRTVRFLAEGYSVSVDSKEE